MSSKSVREFDAHVAQPAETDDADFLPLGDSPVVKGREGGDAGAEERRGSSEREVRGDLEDESFGDDDAFGVAAVGDAAGVLVREVVGEGHVGTELLEALLALWAGAVRVDHAAHGGEIAHLEFGYCGADFGDAADDLMAGDAGVDGRHNAAPLIADLMEIGVTDAAEEDFNLDVFLGWIAPRDRSGRKRRLLTGGGVCFRVVHGSNLDRSSDGRYAKYAILYAEHAMLCLDDGKATWEKNRDFLPKNSCQAPNSSFPHLKSRDTPHKTRSNPAFPRIQSSQK